MQRVFLELNYRLKEHPIAIARSSSPTLLRAFKRQLLKEMRGLASDGEQLDRIFGVIQSAELEKLERVLAAIVPEARAVRQSSEKQNVRDV